MKSLNNLKTLLIIALFGVACSGNKEGQHASSDSIESPSDTVYALKVLPFCNQNKKPFPESI